MMVAATFWMACFAIFLQFAEQAPVMDGEW